MKTISLKISESLERRLQLFAARSDTSKSEVLRRALDRYLSNDQATAEATVAALAADLAGCFAGPADLSTNHAHVDDYGQ
jgi:predicted transcriptional regulator